MENSENITALFVQSSYLGTSRGTKTFISFCGNKHYRDRIWRQVLTWGQHKGNSRARKCKLCCCLLPNIQCFKLHCTYREGYRSKAYWSKWKDSHSLQQALDHSQSNKTQPPPPPQKLSIVWRCQRIFFPKQVPKLISDTLEVHHRPKMITNIIKWITAKNKHKCCTVEALAHGW